MMHVMAYYCHDYATFRSFWFATINSNNMWYCFLKAWCNVAMSKITKKESGFKVRFPPSPLRFVSCSTLNVTHQTSSPCACCYVEKRKRLRLLASMNEKPSIAPGCPGCYVERMVEITARQLTEKSNHVTVTLELPAIDRRFAQQ